MRIETKAKLDYLKGTKSAIADALVEKGQTVSSTDTFRSYADKVRAIKGGGGGLEPGVYFKRHEIPCYGGYYQTWIWWKGELYCFRLPFNGNGVDHEVFKRSGTSWSKIVERMTMCDGVKNPLFFNGKIHIIGGNNMHLVFDGESVTALNNMPNGAYVGTESACVYDGKIVVSNGSAVYEWDESSDSWAQIATLDSAYQYNYFRLFVANGELYFNYNKSVYLYSNGTLTKVVELSGSFIRYIGLIGKYLYVYNSSNYDLIRCDPASWEQKVVGKWAYYGEGERKCFSDTPTPNPYFIMGSNNGLVCNEMIVVEDEG